MFEAALVEDRDQLDFEVQVVGQRRIREHRAGVDHVVRILLEEERRLLVGVAAHFDGVGGVVAPDAVDAPDRKPALGAAHRQRRHRRRVHDIGWQLVVHGIHRKSLSLGSPGASESTEMRPRNPEPARFLCLIPPCPGKPYQPGMSGGSGDGTGRVPDASRPARRRLYFLQGLLAPAPDRRRRDHDQQSSAAITRKARLIGSLQKHRSDRRARSAARAAGSLPSAGPARSRG